MDASNARALSQVDTVSGPDPERRSTWFQIVADLDEKHETAHGRLRTDLRAVEATVESNYHHFEDQLTLVRTHIAALDKLVDRPIDAARLVLSMPQILAIVGAALLIAATLWTVRADVQNLSTKVDDNQRVQAAQLDSLRDALATTQKQTDATQRSYELLRYEVQSIKDALAKGK